VRIITGDNRLNDKADEIIKDDVLKYERNIFIFKIIAIVICYTIITLGLNSIRATAPHWSVWVLIAIQLTLYLLIFFICYQRAERCGINKTLGAILFIILAVLGRAENCEYFIIPLTVIVMIRYSAKNKH
jgi:heme/copper-type cytochrome/quinol oxidase subunit 4